MKTKLLTLGLAAIALCGIAEAAEKKETLDERCYNLARLLHHCRKNIEGGESGFQQECQRVFRSVSDKYVKDCAALWMNRAIKFAEIQKIASDTKNRV